jgi:ABC-type transport system involved in multi-copper enzyme maturation permease subunit
MITLLQKDFRLSRLPLIVAITLTIAPYFAAAAMLYQVYAPDTPSAATIADYLASAAVFGLMLSVVTAGMFAGNIVACERADGSAVFLASQPVSRRQILLSKAILVFAVIAGIWLLHGAMLFGLAPGLAADAKPYVRIENPAVFAGSSVIVATGTALLFSIIGRSPSMAISAGLAAAFIVPWSVYLLSLFVSIAPDDVRLASTIAQWTVGLGGLLGGTAIYLKRVEP